MESLYYLWNSEFCRTTVV